MSGAQTIVVANKPRSARSVKSAVYARSKFGTTSSAICWMSVNGREPWMSQVISLNTVSNMFTVTKRTPASISRRAKRHDWPKRVRP